MLNVILVGYIAPDDCVPSPVILPFKLLNENTTRFMKANTSLNNTKCNNNCVSVKFGTWDTIQCQRRTTCLGECCSVYRLLFVDCVTNLFSNNYMKMEDIMYECHYLKHMKPESMLNFDRALILQWWFCANVYVMSDHCIFEQLPCCVISEIQRVYPNLDGKVSNVTKSLPNVADAKKRLAD